MDISEIRNRKRELAQDIYKLVNDFEKETSATVTGITVDRLRSNAVIPKRMSIIREIKIDISVE
jgi:hypothetical protein